jgi:ABC-type thiamin/hydroxymethylpyrimidine transport system permease subunit
MSLEPDQHRYIRGAWVMAAIMAAAVIFAAGIVVGGIIGTIVEGGTP